MKREIWRRITVSVAWLAIGLLVLAGLANLLAGDLDSPDSPAFAFILFTAIVVLYGGVGAIVITRRPGNAIGWVLWLVGVLVGANLASTAYASWSLDAFAGTLPFTALAGWFAQWTLSPPLVVALLLLPLLFPDGRVPSRRWRPVLLLAFAATILSGLADMLQPGPLGSSGFQNPTGWTGDPALLDVLHAFSQFSPIVALPIVVAAAVVRYRRGSTIERHQLKWFGAAAAFSVFALSIAVVTSDPVAIVAWVIAMVGLGLVPVAIGIAILRYRLFEIDRIISRTISWAATTGLIVAAFVAIVIGLQGALASVTGGDTLAVAGSTLAVAALFQPLRRRVQAAVDRRFNRSGHDAEGVVAAFGERLRNEVDLATLRSALASSADAAVHPNATTVWLRTVAKPPQSPIS